MPRRVIELSQPWFKGMPFIPSHGQPEFSTRRGDKILEFGPSKTSVTHLSLSTHNGTHIDGARHFITAGQLISQYPVERFVCPAVVWDVRQTAPVAVTAAQLRLCRPAARKGDAVLLYLGWADRFRDPSYEVYPYLAPDAADFLIERGINLLGTDTFSPDASPAAQASDYLWPIHGRLLSRDILIIENLGLGLKQVLDKRITLVAVPMRIEGSEASPLVAVAMVEE